MENKLVEKILEDIYMIDSDLRKQEKKLIKIISELIISKPDTKFDSNFAESLRHEVLDRIEDMEEASRIKKEKINNILSFNFMKKSYYIGGGVLVGALLVVLIISLYPGSGLNYSTGDIDLDWDEKIARVDNNAFGLLTVSERPVMRDGAAESDLATMGAGGGMNESAKMSSGMIAPDIIKYNYIYAGDDFEVPSEGDVYKKVAKEGMGKALANKFGGDLGLLNLSKFKNTELANFNILEDREFGYGVYFNLVDNVVSVTSNWQKWPRPDRDCRDEACYEQYRLKIDDVPEDSEIIKIASDAIKEYEVDISKFGEPRINDNWRRSYEMASDSRMAYVPDSIQVVYPQKIDGKEVHDDYSSGIGIAVDVNIRYKKMAGIRGISLNDYQASRYTLESDNERLLKYAKQGGLYSSYVPENPSREIDIELGTPEIGLTKSWKHNKDTGRGEEYFAPTLIFPVISQSEESYFSRKTISIPLLKDILDKADEAVNRPGIPEPMPLLRSSVEEPAIEPMEAPAEMMVEKEEILE